MAKLTEKVAEYKCILHLDAFYNKKNINNTYFPSTTQLSPFCGNLWHKIPMKYVNICGLNVTTCGKVLGLHYICVLKNYLKLLNESPKYYKSNSVSNICILKYLERMISLAI